MSHGLVSRRLLRLQEGTAATEPVKSLCMKDLGFHRREDCPLNTDEVKVTTARIYAEVAAYTRAAQRAEPLYQLVFYFHRHGQYELAWYYCMLALKIPKPDVSHALFILNSVYDYWLDYERASLSQFVFPNESTVGLHASWGFLNNPYAPDDLREYFYPDMAQYAHTIQITTRGTLYRRTIPPEITMPLLIKTKKGSLRVLAPETDEKWCMRCQALETLQHDEHDFGNASLVQLCNLPLDHHVLGTHFMALAGMLVGISSDGRDDQEQTVNLRTYIAPHGAITGSWILFANGGNTFCLTSWYPTITIGSLIFSAEESEANCEPVSWIQDNVPRIFSFFEKATNFVEYHGDVYFLVKWRHGFVPLHSLLILRGGDFQVKGYTYPFAFKEESVDDGMVCSGLEIIEEAGEASVFVACRSKVDGMQHLSVIVNVPLCKFLAQIV